MGIRGAVALCAVVGLFLTSQTSQAGQCYGHETMDGKVAYQRIGQFYNFARRVKNDAKKRYLNSSVGMEFIDVATSGRFYSNNIFMLSDYLTQIKHWMDNGYRPVVKSQFNKLFDLLIGDYTNAINEVNGLLNGLKKLKDAGTKEGQAWYKRELASYRFYRSIPNFSITCTKPKAEIEFVYRGFSEKEKNGKIETIEKFDVIEEDEILFGETFWVQLVFDKAPQKVPSVIELEVEGGGVHKLSLSKTKNPEVFRSEALALRESISPILDVHEFMLDEDKPKEIEADPKKKLKAKALGKTRERKAAEKKGLHLRYRFYSPDTRGRKWRKKWDKQLKWWQRTINKHCKKEKVRIDKIEPLVHDFKVAMFNEHEGSRKKIYKFATAKVENPPIPSYETVISFPKLRSIINTRLTEDRKDPEVKKIDALKTTFHIPVFKFVYARMRGRDAMIPGMVRTNLLAVKGAASLKDIQHETGHLFGLDDDTGGIMSKIRPTKRQLKGRYDNERKYGWKSEKVRSSRCAVMKKYFQ